MKTKTEFIAYLRSISIEMEKSVAETNKTTESFLDGLASWLEESNQSHPENFNWEFASNLIHAGVYYE
jgi:hypothetical protein